MKYRSLLICLSILVITFAGCSSSGPSSEEVARLVAEQVQAAEKERLAAEEHRAAQQAQADTQAALAKAEQALTVARQQAKTAEARAKAEAEHARALEAAKLAEEQARAAEAANAKAAEEARIAEEARAKAKQAKSDARAKAKVQTVTLAAGTPIRVITSSEISTQTANTGDGITLILNEDITDGDTVVARRGATVRGVVSESDPGGRIKGVATISVNLSSLTLADNSEASIRTNDHHVDAPSATGKNVATTAITTGIGAAIGAAVGGGRGAAIGAGAGAAAGTGVALATHGNPAVIAPETVITFNLAAPITVNLPRR